MTIDELRSAAAVVRDATEEGENTATRIGQLFLDTVNTLCNVSTNAIKGYVVISSTSDLPTSPTTDQQMKGYLLDTTLYVWVGTGGDTLDGKYQSAQLKGEDGKTGEKGDSGVSLGEVVLVNDLTTGGDGNALSAEMGKVLNENIEAVSDKIVAIDDKIGNDVTILSFQDNVIQGADYKGYVVGSIYKQLAVNFDANQEFYLTINTDCFSVSTIYLTKDGTTYLSVGDLQSNTKTLKSFPYQVKGLTLYAKSANITKSGTFDYKVEIEGKSGLVKEIDDINQSLEVVETNINTIEDKITEYDEIFSEYAIFAISDELKANTEYKGYIDGKPKLIVDCPVNEDFYVRISSSVISDVDLKISYDGSNFYDYPEQSSFVPTNIDIHINIARQIKAFCIHVKPGHLATSNGDYELSVKLTNTNGILNRVKSLETGKTDGDILHLNKEDEYLQLFENSKYSEEISGASGARTKKCLTLCHFTDIHADAENLSRIKKFTDKYKDYIDDVICTGDMVRNDSSEDFSWWNENGGEGMLMTIGNHDTNVVSGGVSSWRGFGKVNTYNKYFKPYIANWGVTQPSNAESLGKCYYYKDYASYNIRIVALDCMYYDADEDTWFTNTLANAKSLGYGVIVLSHGLGKQGDKIQSTYTAINNTAGMVILDDGTYTYNANVHSRIDEFIGGGGNFICLLGGHFHMDMFGKVNSTTHEQLYLLGDCSARVPLRDHRYVNKTRMQDSFNIVSIDTNLKMIKVFKVGYQYDVYLRRKGTLCYNYETHQMVFNG